MSVDSLVTIPEPRRREKLEGGVRLEMVTDYAPAGDQPTAIAEIAEAVEAGERDQVLLGATGTGKTSPWPR